VDSSGRGPGAAPRSGNTLPIELYHTGKEIPAGIALSHDGKRLFLKRMRSVSQIWQTGTGSSLAKALYQDEVLRTKLPMASAHFRPQPKKLKAWIDRLAFQRKDTEHTLVNAPERFTRDEAF
jgi:hypothetical protein